MNTIEIIMISLLALTALLSAIGVWLGFSGRGDDLPRELAGRFIKLDEAISKIDLLIRDEFGRNRDENQRSFKENREELNNSFKILSDTLTHNVTSLSSAQKWQFEIFSKQLGELIKSFEEKTDKLQYQLERSSKENRDEQSKSLKSFEDQFSANVKDFNELQRQKFDDLLRRNDQDRQVTEDKLREMRETIEGRLKALQDGNDKKLDDIRKVVDEKLQETVEKRFNESFQLISTQLEQVHKGLGEMQTLASGVGDLKKVLTNVKTRGSLGEIQLGAILDQILSREQYEQNVTVRENSREQVEFAIRLPGRSEDNKPLLLPIDSKFPNEDYQRLIEAYDNMAAVNPKDVEAISKQFENSVKKNAKDIRDKYIEPPTTTDFAIMFVPSEGLYAEILRRTGLFETLQRDFKVTVVGPANLVAFLNSLQMGFRTLAIEKRSSEVWEILGAVKTQFGAFGEILSKTKKKLQEATNAIDKAGVRSRAIEKKLRAVQELPADQAVKMLEDTPDDDDDNGAESDFDAT
ncbi:MAG: DNA recombination protein RmuC [Synergistaceae bacterium]|jgi:DNA recombination protein RmuC|nr:DNA recombination protein RmuC [Synergistaceae bacterium]